MNLDGIVDIILLAIYKDRNYTKTISEILSNNDIEYNWNNSKIICDKIEQTGYFEIKKLASIHLHDLYVSQNAKGYEIYSKYGTHTNYLKTQQVEQKKQNTIIERDAFGSFWGGISALITVPLTIVMFVYSCSQEKNQEKINKQINDSLSSISKQLRELKSTSKLHEKTHDNKAALESLKNK